MLTLAILTGYTILGTIGTIILLLDKAYREARILFFNMTLFPVAFMLLLIFVLAVC